MFEIFLVVGLFGGLFLAVGFLAFRRKRNDFED